MKQRLLRLGAVLTLLAGLLVAGVVGATAASATQPCGPKGHSYFDGWGEISGVQWDYGVAADLKYLIPSICSGDAADQDDSAWSMIYDDVANGGWAQSGWIWGLGDICLEHFAQDDLTSTSTPTTVIYGNGNSHCAASGQVHLVWSDYNSAQQQEDMNIDSTPLLSTYWDPATAWGFANTNVEFEGEATSLTSNMPGNASNKENFSSMLYQVGSGDTWSSTCDNGLVLGAATSSSKWSYDANSCNNIDIWTSVVQ